MTPRRYVSPSFDTTLLRDCLACDGEGEVDDLSDVDINDSGRMVCGKKKCEACEGTAEVEFPVTVEYDYEPPDPGCHTLRNGDPGWPGCGSCATVTGCYEREPERETNASVEVELTTKERERLEEEAVEHAAEERAAAAEDEAERRADAARDRRTSWDG